MDLESNASQDPLDCENPQELYSEFSLSSSMLPDQSPDFKRSSRQGDDPQKSPTQFIDASLLLRPKDLEDSSFIFPFSPSSPLPSSFSPKFSISSPKISPTKPDPQSWLDLQNLCLNTSGPNNQNLQWKNKAAIYEVDQIQKFLNQKPNLVHSDKNGFVLWSQPQIFSQGQIHSIEVRDVECFQKPVFVRISLKIKDVPQSVSVWKEGTSSVWVSQHATLDEALINLVLLKMYDNSHLSKDEFTERKIQFLQIMNSPKNNSAKKKEILETFGNYLFD